MGMNRKKSQLIAYFAGLFDGEGNVGIYNRTNDKGEKRALISVSIRMTDPVAVLLLKSEFPEATLIKLKPYQKDHYKITWGFQLYGNNAYRFLKEIEPFVLVKWEQVKVALTYMVHYRKTVHKFAHTICSHCEWADKKLRELKIPDSNAVKTVELLKRHELRQYRAKPEEVDQDCNNIVTYLKDIQERVETRLSQPTDNKIMSAAEKDIVQALND